MSTLVLVFFLTASDRGPAQETLQLSVTEKAWLDAHKDSLVLSFDRFYPPLEFADSNNTFSGFSAELIGQIEKRLDIVFRKEALPWEAILEGLRDGSTALAPAMTSTPQRESFITFTKPYASFPLVIVAKAGGPGNLEELGGLRVAVVRGYTSAELLRKEAGTHFDLVEVESIPAALRDVSSGAVDAFAENLPLAAWHMNERKFPGLRVSGDLGHEEELRIGISKHYPLLASAISKALTSLPEDGKKTVLRHWIQPNAQPSQYPVWPTVIIAGIAVIVLLLSVYTYVMWRRLRVATATLVANRNYLLEQIGNFQTMVEATGVEYWEYSDTADTNETVQDPLWSYAFRLKPHTLNLWTEMIHPADRDHAHSVFMEYIHSGSCDFFEAEYRMRTRDGSWHWMLIKALAVAWDGDGKSSRVLGLKLDIQQMKKAQEESLAFQATANALLEQTSQFIGLFNLRGVAVAVNRASLQWAGISDKDVVGRYFWDTPWWEDAQQARPLLEDIFRRVQSGENVNREVSLLNRQGERVPFEIKASPFRSRSGKTQYIIIEAYDLSNTKKSQTALLDSERKFRSIFENSPCAIAITRFDDGRYIDANNAFLEMMHISRPDLPHLVSGEIDSFPPEHARQIRALLQENRPVHSMETVMHRPDGSLCHVLYSCAPITLDDELCFLSITWDITRLKAIQDMMVQSEKMLSLGGIAAGIAHEINNPLGVVLQASQTLSLRLKTDFPKNRDTAEQIGLDMDLLERYLQARKIHDFARDIEAAAARAADIVRHMLDFSRRSESRRSLCSIPNIIDHALNLAASDYDLKKKYDFKQIRIIRDYNELLPEITCTETEIEQVLLNLLRNAAQAMMEANPPIADPCIRITARLHAQDLRIEIADNGPGIAQENRKRIFEPFFTTKAAGSGTGLGLSVSYFIITKGHGGRMHVASPPEGGTAFIIELPWKEPAPEETPPVQTGLL